MNKILIIEDDLEINGKEMDINPLLATEKYVIAVDARIRIEKN